MKFDTAAVRKCLKSFDFSTLFREHLGWEKHHGKLDVTVDDFIINYGVKFRVGADAESVEE